MTSTTLARGITATDRIVELAAPLETLPPFLQIDDEVMEARRHPRPSQRQPADRTRVAVRRGRVGTAAPHAEGAPVEALWTMLGPAPIYDGNGDGSGTGPKGDKGDQGDPGPPGADGEDGAPGANGQDGAPGADGADGASAYDIAVAEGFVGDEAAWLASLVGPAGQDGADGAPGADGQDGAPGADGADGAPGEGLPAGVIVMWSGTLATIPSGWVLCNGSNGTPDLRDRFIVGAANGANPGATGGVATHQHAAHTGVMNHTHAVNVTDGGHVHAQQRFPTATGGSTGFTVDTSMSGTQAAANNTASATTGITATTSNPAGGVTELTHDSLDNRPPFYALAFIQKA